MKTYVSVECTRCMKTYDKYEHIYCQCCMNKKDEELHKQDELIDKLHNKMKRLEKTIEELKNGNK